MCMQQEQNNHYLHLLANTLEAETSVGDYKVLISDNKKTYVVVWRDLISLK